ncbi:DUF7149 domain-containing protein [Helicobacter sp. 23-1048]
MLKLQPIESIEAQKFFTPLYFQSNPLHDSEVRFDNALQEYHKKLQNSSQQNERAKAEILGGFFRALGFDEDEVVVGDSQKGNSEIDISIKKRDKVSVICEVKAPKSPEMIRLDNYNTKSLHQTILYYLREKTRTNNEVKFIIITNFTQFYIFREAQFDKFFYQDKRIRELFKQLPENHANLTTKIPKSEQDNNQDFYTNIKEYLASDEYERFLVTEGLQALQPLFLDLDSLRDSKDYKPFIKAFHRDFLLGEFNPNINNQISENFYKELLYILGLQQGKDKEKLTPRANNNGTLYDNILHKLAPEDKNFENVMKLIILWLNRILFLKLIEANLVRFSTDRQLGGG